MKTYFLILFIALFALGCNQVSVEKKVDKKTQNKIIDRYLKKGAWQHHYLTKEWEEWIDKGLKEDSTIAYLWQQKALPYWKQTKYSQAIQFYDKAVQYDRQKWLSRLGFLKCIFAKNYNDALIDLITYKKEFGTTYEQDHSLEFYMALCYLQLNQYDNALVLLKETIGKEEIEHGTTWVHYLDRFYLAITYYELNDYEKAITEFDKVLKEYPTFSDAQYYKSLCLKYIDKYEEAKLLMSKGKLNYENGNSFNEDSSTHETYPYQVTWQWKASKSLLKL